MGENRQHIRGLHPRWRPLLSNLPCHRRLATALPKRRDQLCLLQQEQPVPRAAYAGHSNHRSRQPDLQAGLHGLFTLLFFLC